MQKIKSKYKDKSQRFATQDTLELFIYLFKDFGILNLYQVLFEVNLKTWSTMNIHQFN